MKADALTVDPDLFIVLLPDQPLYQVPQSQFPSILPKLCPPILTLFKYSLLPSTSPRIHIFLIFTLSPALKLLPKFHDHDRV